MTKMTLSASTMLLWRTEHATQERAQLSLPANAKALSLALAAYQEHTISTMQSLVWKPKDVVWWFADTWVTAEIKQNVR
jgi:hypothetical protein